MKKFVVLSALLGVLSVAQAQVQPPSGLAPFLGFGITFGGDQIGRDIQYNDGGSTSLHAGNLMDLRGGVEYRAINSPLSLQFSVGYHADMSNASNGRVSFERFPVEALGHYNINETWRVGGGLRKALSAKTKASGAGSGYVLAQDYDSSVGAVLEVEAFVSPSFGIKLRGVSEKFKPKTTTGDVDGSHFGVIGVYYFK